MNTVLSSGARTEDEGLYPIQHGYWEEVMLSAIEREESGEAKEVVNDRDSSAATVEKAKQRAAAKAAAASERPARRRRRR